MPVLDRQARAVLARPLEVAARLLDRPGITPDRLTVVGLLVGLACAAAAAAQWWWPALLLWGASRWLDGFDGPLARRRAAREGTTPGGAGGFLDITADMVVYAATTLGVLVGVTLAAGDGASPWRTWAPFVAVLATYYVNGAAFLAFSSVAERVGAPIDDGRSLSFLGGLAEGTETVVVHALWLLLPGVAWAVAWVWAVVVALSAGYRVLGGYRILVRADREVDA